MIEQYRLLQVGEAIQIGDEFQPMFTESWYRISDQRSAMIITGSHVPHRRKVQPPTGIEASVCADITARQRLGVEKYGTTVKDNPLSLREWLQHSYEECLDQAIYLRRAIDEL